MDDLIKEIIGQAPATGILLLAVWMLWKAIEKERDEARQERRELIDIVVDVKRRTKEIEKVTTGDTSPTISRRSDVT